MGGGINQQTDLATDKLPLGGSGLFRALTPASSTSLSDSDNTTYSSIYYYYI